jgi:hypothetical protein
MADGNVKLPAETLSGLKLSVDDSVRYVKL